MENPFKFGSLVDAPYFTDRVKELEYIVQFLKSENHLILISPRRFGKSCLVKKAVVKTQRPYLWLNMQSVLSKEDLAAKLLKALLNQYKFEKIKYYFRNFRVVPSVNMNPMTDELSVSFQPSAVNGMTAIEDVMALLQKVSSPDNKLIVVFDEFQSILEVDKNMDKQLRAIMQEQTADEILAFTGCHPYYTQELAFAVWNNLLLGKLENVMCLSVEDIVATHDLDYERLWLNFNKTDKYVMVSVSMGYNPIQDRKLPTSTMTSAVLRLTKKGYIFRSDRYEVEDPFFQKWIQKNVVD